MSKDRQFTTILEYKSRFKIESFEIRKKKKKERKGEKTLLHRTIWKQENRLRVGNTPFIEHPVWLEQKCNGTERFRIRTRESLYPLFPVLCDVWYTRVTVQTVKNQTVYSTNSRIPKRLRKNARSIGSYIKILFFPLFFFFKGNHPSFHGILLFFSFFSF